MKKTLMAALLVFSGMAVADGESSGYRELTEVYLNVDTISFYLDEDCPNGAVYWRLDSKHINVDKGFAMLLDAFSNRKKVYVVYQDDPVAKEQCMVKRINIRESHEHEVGTGRG